MVPLPFDLQIWRYIFCSDSNSSLFLVIGNLELQKKIKRNRNWFMHTSRTTERNSNSKRKMDPNRNGIGIPDRSLSTVDSVPILSFKRS